MDAFCSQMRIPDRTVDDVPSVWEVHIAWRHRSMKYIYYFFNRIKFIGIVMLRIAEI